MSINAVLCNNFEFIVIIIIAGLANEHSERNEVYYTYYFAGVNDPYTLHSKL